MTSAAELSAAPGPAEREKRTGFLELFFDLVFVFAITQVTALALEDTSAGGFARAAVVLAIIWWAWSAYAWLTNAIEVERPLVRLLMLAAMAGTFFMALAVPDAFTDEGAWFAVPYLVVRVLQLVLYVEGLRDDPAHRRAVLRLAPWFTVAPAIVLAGGLVDDPARTWLWGASLAIDVAGTLLAADTGFRVSPAHFAERYGLFVIIVLGESIVATGVGAREIDRDGIFALSVLVAFAGVAALWWAYFGLSQLAAERALLRASPERRAPLARDLYTFFHFPIALGIVLVAVAGEKTLAHPQDPLSEAGRVALGAGVAVFLSGFVLGRLRVLRRLAWERVAAGAAAVLLVLLLDGIAAVALFATVVGILVAMLAVEAVRLRELRAHARA